MGKSSYMIHTAAYNALNNKVVLLFSLEMPAKKVGLRIISNFCDTTLWKLKRLQNRSETEQKAIIRFAEKLRSSPLIIETTPGIDIQTMKSVIQKVQMRYKKIDLIVLDYLRLMSGPGINDNSRVSELSRNMKNISIQYNCPIIVGSQLSRMCEERDDKRPLLSDLRESGSLEQDADLVMMLYRDHYYNYNPNHQRILEVLIRKFRNGEIKKIIVDYDMQKQSLHTINYNTALGKVATKFDFV